MVVVAAPDRRPEVVAVVVDLAQGSYRGEVRGGASVFLGVPYAAPPVGELRFAAPRPALVAAGVQDATRFGPTVPAPPQRSPVSAHYIPDPRIPGPGGLNLNVWTPDPAGRAPVLVWLHGGGFVTGTSAVTAFDGGAFAREGVVVVTVNYRLAADGYLAVPGAVANRGLLDQVAALEWVQDNIGSFGGDPARVTLAGESAGAMSVLTLLAVPRARGTFHRAISQSGDASHVHTAYEADLVAEELARVVGVHLTPGALARLPEQQVHEAVNEVIGRVGTGEGRWAAFRRLVFQPVVDGDVLPRHPLAAIADGAAAEVDLLIGANTDEYGLFTVPSGLADRVDEDVLHRTVTRLGLSPAPLLAAYRDLLGEPTAGELYTAIQGDWFCQVPIRWALAARAGAGGPRTGYDFGYEFAWRPPTFGGRLGACHTLEVPFVFDTLADPWGKGLRGPGAPQQVADEVHGAWVRFISDGDPGWPAYHGAQQVRVLDLEPATVSDPWLARLPLWEGAG